MDTQPWLAELSEEWVDQENNNISNNNNNDDGRAAVQHGSGKSVMDFGSIVVRDQPPFGSASPSESSQIVYGTTVVRETDNGPDRKQAAQAAGKSQLAWAISAIAGKGDLLAESTPKTPNRLQALFMGIQTPPSPAPRKTPLNASVTGESSSIDTLDAAATIALPASPSESTSIIERRDDSSEPSIQAFSLLAEGVNGHDVLQEPTEGDLILFSLAQDQQPNLPELSTIQEEPETEREDDALVPDLRADPEAELIEKGNAAVEHLQDLDAHSDHNRPAELTHTIQPPTSDFSFHIEKTKRQSWRAHLPPPTPPPALDTDALRTSTPTGVAVRTALTASQAAPAAFARTPSRLAAAVSMAASTTVPDTGKQASPALGIFKFHHDTPTRRHLEALVHEIDALQSPPQSVDSSRIDKQKDAVWLEHLQELRASRTSADLHRSAPGIRYALHQNTFLHHQYADENDDVYMDEDGRLSSTRSAKRVRLSMSAAYPPSPRDAILQNTNTRATPYLHKRPYRLAQSARRPLAASATPAFVPRTTTPLRPPLRSLPSMTMPFNRHLRSSAANVPQLATPHYNPPSRYSTTSPAVSLTLAETPQPERQSNRNESTLQYDTTLPVTPQAPVPVSPAVTAIRNRVEDARALMDRIRIRQASAAQTSGRVLAEQAGPNPPVRFSNPAPAAASLSPDEPGDSRSTSAALRTPLIVAPAESTIVVPQAHGRRAPVMSAALPKGPSSLSLPQQPQRPSSSSYASSSRFHASTSTRITSGSTAATSVVMQAQSAEEQRQTLVSGMVQITPDVAKGMLTRDMLGDMDYDDVHNRWKRLAPQPAGAVTQPYLSVIPEISPMLGDHSDDDPFRDISSMERSKTQSAIIAPMQLQSINTIPKQVADRSAAPTEKTSTPPLTASAGPPLVSPDLPIIAQTRKSSDNSALDSDNVQPSAPPPPRSALKRVDSFCTPLVSSRIVPADRTKLGRSVSFSDGRKTGKIAPPMERFKTAPPASALRYEVHDMAQSTDDSEREDASGIEADDDGGHESTNPLNPSGLPITFTLLKSRAVTSPNCTGQATLRCPPNTDYADETSSEQSTPTGVMHLQGRSRSMRLRLRQQSATSFANSTLAWHRQPLPANATILTECSFAVSHDRLVQILTDVMPFEPDWQNMTRIDLSGKGVDSVVRLKEFLPKLDDAILSNNGLTYVTGISSSVRSLDVAQNKLSNLTSFGHLLHLESLNVSNNPDLSEVHQLSCLRHLRIFKADHCAIGEIQGLHELDGLIHVSLRGNALQSIHLAHTSWRRVESLDLAENHLIEVAGLSSLNSLKAIDLDNNRLTTLEMESEAAQLRILRVSSNKLTKLDLCNMPHLRTVYADDNRIKEVKGTSGLRHLENVSLRDQRHCKISLNWHDLRDIRRLYLSNNTLPSIFPSEQFHNLVLLELAGCRLTSLHPDFAALAPNCRVLNLDNNFIQDLTPLAGMSRLKRLSVQGARLERLKPLLASLAELKELEMLDVRMNPLTLGFYPLPTAASTAVLETAVSPTYAVEDKRFRSSLPNEWLAKRSAYRALVLVTGPSLKLLDGLKVGQRHRERAQELLDSYASATTI